MKVLAIVFTLLFSLHAQAGRETGNGGDTVGQEFETIGRQLLKDLQGGLGKSFPEVDLAAYENKLNEVTVRSVEKSVSGRDADNYPELNLIVVSRAGWTAIAGDLTKKRALAFHEYLSVMGLEASEKYPISGRLLEVQTNETQICKTIELSKTVTKLDRCLQALKGSGPSISGSADANDLLAQLAAQKYIRCVAEFQPAARVPGVLWKHVFRAHEDYFLNHSISEKNFCDVAELTNRFLKFPD
jgi:hypothetical protein